MSKFYSTPVNSETDAIVDELLAKNYTEMHKSGDSNLFIDTVNKIFWFCNPEHLQQNSDFLNHLKEPINQTNLKEIQSWEQN